MTAIGISDTALPNRPIAPDSATSSSWTLANHTREASRSLLRTVGPRFIPLPPRGFLQAKRPDAPGCLVLDVRLPGLSGLDFQSELVKSNIDFPVIFISGHGDIPMTVRPSRPVRSSSWRSPSAIMFCSMPCSSGSRGIAPGVTMRRLLPSCKSASNLRPPANASYGARSYRALEQADRGGPLLERSHRET
jgi:hypothetical protein